MASAKAVGPGFAGALVDLDAAAFDAETRRGSGTWSARCSDLVAVAFDGLHVQQHGRVDVLDLGQDVDQAGQVVAVDGAQVFDAEGLEDLARPDRRA